MTTVLCVLNTVTNRLEWTACIFLFLYWLTELAIWLKEHQWYRPWYQGTYDFGIASPHPTRSENCTWFVFHEFRILPSQEIVGEKVGWRGKRCWQNYSLTSQLSFERPEQGVREMCTQDFLVSWKITKCWEKNLLKNFYPYNLCCRIHQVLME